MKVIRHRTRAQLRDEAAHVRVGSLERYLVETKPSHAVKLAAIEFNRA